MIISQATAENTAKLLMQIKAIKLQPDDPFTWASGWKSPIYCDNRLTLSFPPVRNFIREELSKGMVEKFGKPDVVVGVATGAIAHGVLVAEYLGLPFAYVRSAPKSHGRQNQIEGAIEPGQFAVVVEDLVSTGMSSLAAVDALRAAEVNVSGMMAIFSYDFAVAKENFQQAECDLYTLSDYPALLKLAQRNGFISSSEKKLLEAWRLAPSEWSI
jgi:orotate phosphoribosyltransferase